ncbi:AAA family ATPase [Paenibacillus sp. DCT19]|uniref:AAA family ATPase n=1 Tax=Paenibacillus sp. DCT19 TaxID=2211212 RepID=UPI000FE1A27F|nr:AAA family ATPase [Paenibacillus sp. DCT19]
MHINSVSHKLLHYVDAQFPILYLNTFEETKVDKIIKDIAYGREIIEWNASKGLVNFLTKNRLLSDMNNLEQILGLLSMDDELKGRMLVIKDVHHFIGDPHVMSILKEIAIQIYNGLEATIILVSPILKIPTELEKYITIVEIDYMGENEIKKLIKDFIEINGFEEPSEELLDDLTVAFKGLTEYEIVNILSLAISKEGSLKKGDLDLIYDQKYQMVQKSGILEMVSLNETFGEIGGLENLKDWLSNKAKVFKNMNKALEFGVDIPKGVLVVGLPGCGKSLNAKATAHLFGIPLLRLDMGKLLGKYVGESEANMRKAIKLAEAISPCVLWIDELEKAFAGIGNSGNAEVATRLFGYFLTWMQEKNSPTFVVATANDTSNLPPELMRKGRFDEIFYVDLPDSVERKKIFEIHLTKRRKNDVALIDLNQLSKKTEGFSGADIEGVVKESIETAFVLGENQVTTKDIITSIENTTSLSVLFKDKLTALSEGYKNNHFKSASKR